MTKLYGIDLDQKITPLIVRDALVNCFFKAHCEDTGVDVTEAETNKTYCKTIVVKAFEETKGNFDNPTKKDIINVMSQLAVFSKSFRNPEIIKKHAKEMMSLVKKLD
jgi:hypothetical protein